MIRQRAQAGTLARQPADGGNRGQTYEDMHSIARLIAGVAALNWCSPPAWNVTASAAPPAADHSFDAQIDQNATALLAEGRKGGICRS
jgi:hypothetical protein